MIADEHPVQAAGGDGKSIRAISHEKSRIALQALPFAR